MEVTQEIVLPVLLAAIVANTVILLLVVVAARFNRRDRMSRTRSALQGGLMSTSFVDQSGRAPWRADDSKANAGIAGSDGDADADVDAGAGGDAGADVERAAWDADQAAAVDGSPAATDVLPPGADPDEPVEPQDEVVPSQATQANVSTSGVDPLTGLLGHRAFTRALAAEDVRIRRYKAPATVVIFELGGLDRLVERLGSDAADRIIPALADTTRRLAREVDQVGRIANGRFAVLLPETDEIAAINYVERVRRACELWLESGAIALRLAAGWAGTAGDPTLPDAMRLATDRMYLELRRDGRRATDR